MNHLYTLAMSIVAVIVWETLIKHILEVSNYRMRMKLPGTKVAEWLQQRHLLMLQKLEEDWIHQAEALHIVGSYDYVDDQIRELVHAYDVYVTPDNKVRLVQDAGRVRIQLQELNHSVPKKILDRFEEQNPLSYRDGMYSRQSLIIWLRSEEQNWEEMLEKLK
ncbi:MAG: hypothetical protein F4139_12165 [Gemmatimonadetes bacterium]|nr:hypothetical protein [Gemmatimonadota bacterium]MYH53674.1 hypothetical protein [Gemmatimonadota bacterium]MYK65095.1 hypothetical protein [Gemmatimonadota bacterium]